ncbi:ABC transporter ATP-binding protein [Tissierella praeacuta]|uniref:Peptide/nickel transport system ATP-binding protein n=1 Tax=Tissierella praeacuta DSM 18095 TaxID=1123404 RepID=A0A1M4V0U9_9FIRM|nr:oligopeptide/dipeptide ABC transporter ATP-binding protein [Tissierella praeacuta]MBU5255132.1 ATP-binding cassette domain-containing protein [Tissierella praeacuta]TCU74022.1 peptide/nickel transport system ATP-binding protein [Tissierella praeacuta]SHE62594.1 peptide/nickel transport system ATP-binding protein [Tissierella praeacuta DSM 18095]SUP02766.1 Glutathione import ATP-binding protein GsiA [Tissierella praeacuta]
MEPILKVRDLKKYFNTPKGLLHAVDGVTFDINKGETLGVVGESGCGKSTLGRVILHLLEATDGELFYEGEDITKLTKTEFRELRQKMQIIFQDPFSSLNPRMTVSEIIKEPIIIHKTIRDKKEIDKKVSELMDTVGLADRLVNTYPHELDGGRRQRIGIARALALNPGFIVCDEPVSALDVSIQAQVLNLMQDLQKEMDLTYMFITHDLSVVKHISNDILVMYLGQLVEKTNSKDLFKNPLHPYTKALLSAIPVPSLKYKRERVLLKGELASPINPKPGCRFAQRCIYAKDNCHVDNPVIEEVMPGHFVACHHIREINGLK